MSHIDDIWDFLSNDKETAEALYDSHLSLVTMKTNQAMKGLTALAFVIFPMTLVARMYRCFSFGHRRKKRPQK